ncbi:MAG: hypothetical protein KJ804_16075 [Proteobacteria bacterium]|nr:hypothetical protein [Pseudomonadota bacterium]MBU1059829.1 hypothetical protein [Pseudomonadota bacterium]
MHTPFWKRESNSHFQPLAENIGIKKQIMTMQENRTPLLFCCFSITHFLFFSTIINTNSKETTLTINRLGLLFFFTTLLILLSAGNILAMSTHSIHIEWDYDQSSAPVDSELTAYHLYQDGIKICQFDYPYDFAGNCTFISNDGLFNFTLTAVFEDGSESPHSAPFPFRLGAVEAPNAGTLTGVYRLLLK